MEAPQLCTPSPTNPTTPTPSAVYPGSLESSPRSRRNDSFDADPLPPAKLRLMCSYGGHIVPRPHDKSLCYVGGDTRIIVIDRQTTLSDLHHRLSKNLFNNQPFSLKYQLPSEDLDSLITVTSDEDLENMVEEYDRLNNIAAAGGLKSGRLRLFLFPKSPSSIEQLIVETASTKSDDWFFNALNGKTSTISASDHGFSESSSVNCLLGLDDDFVGKAAVVEKDVEAQIEGPKSVVDGNVSGNYVINHDVHSVPDSPMLGTSSSFGSTSSSPSVANLPPIRTHVDDNPKVRALGIEEQFQQMGVGVAGNGNPPPPLQKQEELGAFIAAGAAAVPMLVGGDYPNRFFSDDERSDHSSHRTAQQIQQVQFQTHQISQFHQKQANAIDLPSPDSVSSEGSLANAMSRQRQSIYQEPLIQIQSGNTMDQNNTKIQMQPQIQESSYVITNQYDQNQPQLHQPQLHQPQQFLHPSNHYIPSGAVPMTSYYSVYPSQHQNHPPQSAHDQHYPVYFVSGKQAQAYNFPVQQPSYSELPPSSIAPHTGYNQARNVPSSNPEMASGVYRPTAPQPQYVGFSQIHQPTSGPNSPYAYEFSDPAHPQLYYTPLPPQFAAQYQTMTSAPDASAQVPAESMKLQGRNLQQ